jgi:pilus assembly protein CpaE
MARSKQRSRERSEGYRSLLQTRIYETPSQPSAVSSVDGGQGTLFFACHGGTGSTTLAVNTGAMLARAKKRTCIVDLDLQFGDVLTALDLKGDCPVSDLIADLDSVDAGYLQSKLPRHGSGLYVLSQVGYIDGLSSITHSKFSKLMRRLRRCFDVVLFDGVRDFNDHALAALDVADTVVMVATQDLPALKGLVMRFELFKRLNYDPSRVRVVINRCSGRTPVSLQAAIRSLEVAPEFFVTNDSGTVSRSLRDGRPLIERAPGARVTREIGAMVEQMFGVRPGTKQGLLSRLLGR